MVTALSSSRIGSSSLQEPWVSPPSPTPVSLAPVVLDSLPASALQPSSSSVGVLVAQATPVKPPVPFTFLPLLVPKVVPPVTLVAPAIPASPPVTIARSDSSDGHGFAAAPLPSSSGFAPPGSVPLLVGYGLDPSSSLSSQALAAPVEEKKSSEG